MTKEEKIICKEFLNDADNTHSCNEYKLLMALLEQETVSRESYEHEYFLRKEFEGKIAKLERTIEELQRQSCEDCVSRVKAMEICKSRGHDNSAHCISELPSVTPKTKWISVNERLPEDRENVLFSTKAGIVFEGKFFDDKSDLQWYEYRYETFEQNNDVIAWMPLPASYQGESEGEHD